MSAVCGEHRCVCIIVIKRALYTFNEAWQIKNTKV